MKTVQGLYPKVYAYGANGAVGTTIIHTVNSAAKYAVVYCTITNPAAANSITNLIINGVVASATASTATVQTGPFSGPNSSAAGCAVALPEQVAAPGNVISIQWVTAAGGYGMTLVEYY
jgi:hypothetical protein